MSDTLTARLLAEIERREGINGPHGNYGHGPFVDEMAAYLAALRKIVKRHSERGGDCSECGDMTVLWPCPTITAVAEALDVTP